MSYATRDSPAPYATRWHQVKLMRLIPYPAPARTLEITGPGIALPQNILTSEFSGERHTLELGYPRWYGSVRVTVDTLTADDLAAMTRFYAHMTHGANWTSLPLGVESVWPEGQALTVTARDVAGGTITATGVYAEDDGGTRTSPLPGTLAAAVSNSYCYDARRVRLIESATGAGGGDSALSPPAVRLGFAPRSPLPAVGAVLNETLRIEAHFRAGEDARLGPLQSKTPDWSSDVELPWIERVAS